LSGTLKPYCIAYSLFFLLTCSLLSGCRARTHFELDQTAKELAPDATMTINLTSAYPPQGTRYIWYSDKGRCEPPETESPWTKYIAPHEPGQYRVTVEVKNGNRTLFSDGVSLNVIAPDKMNTEVVPSSSALPEEGNSLTSASARIRIRQVPTYDPVGGPAAMEEIAGEVTGVDLKGLRIVIYAWTDNWYVQPFSMAPFTDLEPDGKWSTQSHLGSRYAALLVKPSFNPRNIISTLPAVGGDVLAVNTTQGRK
jgi:hypothetical protein